MPMIAWMLLPCTALLIRFISSVTAACPHPPPSLPPSFVHQLFDLLSVDDFPVDKPALVHELIEKVNRKRGKEEREDDGRRDEWLKVFNTACIDALTDREGGSLTGGVTMGGGDL